MIFRHLLNMRSHPTWVRGLKPENGMKPLPTVLLSMGRENGVSAL